MGAAGVQMLSRPKKRRLKRRAAPFFTVGVGGVGVEGEKEFPESSIRKHVPLHRVNNESVPHWKWHLSGSKERGSHLVKEEWMTVEAGGTELRTTMRGTTGATSVRSIGSLLLPYVVATRLKTRATLIRPRAVSSPRRYICRLQISTSRYLYGIAP